ncbi:MAG: hypothetical protein U0O39_00325, partial [Akkermansia sp.]
SMPEMDGVMGNNLLKRFNLVYDSQNSCLYLIPNNLLYTPFYDCLLQPRKTVPQAPACTAGR